MSTPTRLRAPIGLADSRPARWTLWAGVVVVVWAVAAATLRRGVPPGIVVQGLVLGSLTGLTAMGLVLIYRSARIVNFAQAEIGVLASTVGIIMVTGFGLPYVVAAPAGLLAAVLTGLAVDAFVVRRLFNAPRLILTVATVGIYEVLGALEIEIPRWFSKNLTQLTRFETPFASSITFHLRPYRFDGNSVLALALVPVVLGAVAWFLGRSDLGVAIRAASDSGERAVLLGIPVRRLSRVTWMVAAGLSGLAALLRAPIVGPQLGGVGGATALLAPLAAAVVARMDNLPRALLAAMGIEVFQQVVFWNYSQSHTVDVALFAVVLVALLVQRRRFSRSDDGGLGGYVAVREVRPIPAALRDLREVRFARIGGLVLLAGAATGLPWILSNARLILLAYVCLYGMVAVSLVVLTGWAGQISFGQFAFVGVGAAVAGSLMVHAGADLFVAVLCATLTGATAAVLVGIPALRIRGLFLAVATLAFAVPVSTYLLNHAYFPLLTPAEVAPPVLIGRFPLASARAFFYLCLVVLAVVVVLARNFRRSRAGRAVVAVRDNERAAAAFGISPVRAKLTAFAVSGALAGMAGGLYVVAQRGIGFSGFDPSLSLAVFTAVVVGGLGSIPGALLGAFYVQEAQHFHGGVSLLATGGGLLALLLFVPGGLGDLVYRIRDAALRALARSRGISVPSLLERPQAGLSSEFDETGPTTPVVADADTMGPPLVRCEAIDAGYGQIQVLFDVGLEVGAGELLALLGTNGAGKSTVLRVISGLLEPSGGRVYLDGRDITALSPADRIRAGLVTVPGGRGVFPSLTVSEHLRLAGWLYRDDPVHLETCRRQVFELFPPLVERVGVRAGELSGGEQQMLTLAQALFCRPRVLLIDELSLGLAPTVVAALLAAVRQINAAGVSVVVVEQSTNVAAGLAQRAVFMEKGQVRFTGPTAGLLDRPDLLRSVFLRQGQAAGRAGGTTRAGRAGGTTRAASAGQAGRGAKTTASATPVLGAALTPTPASSHSNGQSPRSGGSPRLALRDVRFRYGGITAIDGVTLELADREILGIIGSNGAGKTTLLDVCSGFLTVDTGRVELDGADVTHLTAAARAELGLGRSFQDARLFPSLTVREAVATALERHVEVRDPLLCLFHTGSLIESERVVAGRAGELIEMLGLGRYQDAFVSELSTGTRRIVELACALAHEPRALLLDEPSSGIAQREGEALAELLLEVRHQTGAALLVVEHDIPLVSSISDRLICLELGAVISDGQPSEVLADPLVIASYLGTDPAAWKRSGNGSSDSTRAKTRARRAQPAAGHRVAPSRAPG